MIAIILAGGRGIRLWPESRQLHPKQLCKFSNQKSMLQNTLERLSFAGFSRLLVVTGDDLKNAVEEITDQLDASIPVEICSEPEGKNTAPAVALALTHCIHEAPDTLLGIFPADHYIGQPDAFLQALQQAFAAAQKGFLTVLGIPPQRPETGYGYIERTEKALPQLPQVFPVRSFTEKPSAEVATAYIKSGRYSWNAGIYLSRLDILLQEYQQYLPELYTSILQGETAFRKAYPQFPAVSLDFGIAEKSHCMAVVAQDFGWCDLGNWNALEMLHPADSWRNVCAGSDILTFKSQNCLLKQQDKTLILYGVQNLLVVETKDIVFVTDRRETQQIREVISSLKAQQRTDLL